MHFLSFGKTIDVYHSIFLRAWDVLRHHKELWIFGLFASVLNSGVIFQQSMHLLARLGPVGDLGNGIKELVTNKASWLLEWIQQILLLDSWHALLSLTLLIGGCFLFLLICLCAQQILLCGVNRSLLRKSPIPFRSLFAEVKHIHLLRLFSVNALLSLSLLLIVLFASYPFTWLLTLNAQAETLLRIAFCTFLLPLFLLLNILAMFCLVQIARSNDSLGLVFVKAWGLVRRHWLLTFEVTLMLFLLSLAFAGLGMIVLYCFLIVLGLLSFLFGDLQQSIAVLTPFFFLAFSGISMLYSALMTTFSYSVWTECLERLCSVGWHPALEEITRRIASLFSRT